jgi:hypothetical protein
MKTNHYLPDSNRMSVLTATVLLAFALAHLLSASVYSFGVQIFGRVIRFDFDLRVIIVVLASGLTAMGTDWLLQSHPMMQGKRTVEHWFVPMLTTLVLGVPLHLLPLGTFWWWLGLGVGGAILVSVFWAEYVAVSPGDTAYPTAMVVLTVISFTLYLILALALRYANVRLFLLAPAFFGATFLVSLRTLHLRSGGRWQVAWSLGIALIGVQLAAGLHYLPVSPVRYGIFLLAPLYALTGLAAGLLERMPLRRAVVEPLAMFVVMCGTGLLLG